MSHLYPYDNSPRIGYQRTSRIPGPIAQPGERSIRYWIIAAPIALALLFAFAGGQV